MSTLFATGLGIGMIPLAPGTWGSVEGWFLAAWFVTVFQYDVIDPSHPRLAPLAAFCAILGIAATVAILGVFVSTRAEEVSVPDPGPVVIDEVVGQLIACAPLARWGCPIRLPLWITSFLLFRLFDVWKPGPIRKLQDLPGGWGIMADDVAAGILAGAITYGIGRVS
jgi:phosphatidylglycerophosphatase A